MLKIEMCLQSDALAGSGVSLTGEVDRDIAFDRRGLPIVPAKRIRGVLREAAEEIEFLGLIEEGVSAALFGLPGNSFTSPFSISDGKIENADKVACCLDRVQANKDIATLFSPRCVLAQYAYKRAQTALEDGTAKENTLRISRVLKKGLKFHFDVECPKDYVEKLRLICRASKFFGGSRNRGLGEICLKLLDCETVTSSEWNDVRERAGATEAVPRSQELREMAVSVHALSKLVVSDSVGANDESDTYIPGATLLGAFAARFLAAGGGSSASASFKRIFLSGETTWCNLYPNPGSSFSSLAYYPAPLSVRKWKDKEGYVDLTSVSVSGSSQEVHNGTCNEKRNKECDEACNGHRSIGKVYLADASDAGCPFYKHSPRMEVEYHHRRAKDRAYGKAFKPVSSGFADSPELNDGGTFFQFQVLEGEQFFKGRIIGALEDLETIKALLPSDGVLRLGKSKVAQYGKCKVSFSDPCPVVLSDVVSWEIGETMSFRLLSDALLLNEYGHPEPNPNLLVAEIAKKLGVSPEKLVIDEARLFLRRRLVGGYLGVWRLPRVQHPAMLAGSVVGVKNDSDDKLDMRKLAGSGIGLRAADGFGQLAWSRVGDLQKDRFAIEEEEPEEESELPDTMSEEARGLMENLLRQGILKRIRTKAREKAQDCDFRTLSGAFLSRMMHIVDAAESLEEFEKFFVRIGTSPKKKNGNDKDNASEEKSRLNDKPLGQSLRKIAREMFFDLSTPCVCREKFKNFVFEQYLPKECAALAHERISEFKQIDNFYEYYREYIIAFLAALKLCKRNPGEKERGEV